MTFFKTFVFVLFLGCSVLMAQGEVGRIEGTVTDSLTGDVLYGANAFLQGTSLGAASNIDGEFTITRIPSGSYNLIIRYIGYQEKEIPIEIKGGTTISLDVTLVNETIEGEEVVVTGQASGQLDAINQQLSANTIKNIVSADKIRELPDDNAATALSRLPGVSLMNGDQVVIRGIEAKLNQVLVNGIQMPSTDMENRSTSLGFVSSSMLSGIEVIKAITPDMDANTIGGVVNLRLREAPSNLHFDVLAQGNYNYSDRTTENYKFWASISNRFFGDKLGVFIQANTDRSDGGNQRASRDLTIDGSSNIDHGEAVYLTTRATFDYQRSIVDVSGGTLILDYKLPDGKLVLQNTYAGNFTDQRNNRMIMDFQNTQAVVTMDRNKYGRDLWINALQAENTFGNIKAEVSLSHSSTQQYTRIAYEPTFPGTGWTNFINSSGSVAPFGRDAQGNAINYTSRTAQTQMTMEQAYSIFDNINPEEIDRMTLEGWPSGVKRTFNQKLYNSSLDVTAPYNFSKDIAATFKVGGKYVRTTRDNDFDRFFSNANDEDTYANVLNYFPDRPRSATNRLRFTDVMETNFERGENFLSDEYDFKNGFQHVINSEIYDEWLRTSMSGWTPALKRDDSWKDDWNGAESFTAGYLMGTFNIFQNLTILGGVRYERYNMDYHAQFTFTIHSVYGDAVSTINGSLFDNPDTTYQSIPNSMHNVDRTDENLFPGVQIKYKVNDWSDIRLAYTTGISRPDYLSIIPKIHVFPSSNYEIGNPKLRPTTADNFDVVVSLYNNEIGLFAVNGFYKELKDVMYRTRIHYGSVDGFADEINVPDSAFLKDRFNYNTRFNDVVNTSLNNPNMGYIRGIEIEWQTNFWYLPQPLNSIVLNINYTKSWSNINYRILTPDVRRVEVRPGVFRNEYFMQDTTYKGRLIQHANDVLNAAIGIDYKGFSGRLSFNMRGNVLTSVGNRPEESAYTGNIYRWDFTLKQALPFDGLSIAFNGVNIFHNATKSYRNYRINETAPVTENLVTVLYPPTIYQFYLMYSF